MRGAAVIVGRLAAARRIDRGISARVSVTVLTVLVAALAAYVLLHWPRYAVRYPDSEGYINWSSARSAFYPLVIYTWRTVTGSVDSIIYVQFVAVVASMWWLAFELYRTTRSCAAGVVLVLATMAQRFLWDQVFTVLTEGLFLALIMAATALLLRVMRTRSLRAMVALSTVAALAVAARPAGYPILLYLVAARWLTRVDGGWRYRRLAAALLPALAVLLASFLAWYIVHGDGPKRSLARLNLFGKIAFVSAPDADTQFPAIRDLIDHSFREAREIDHGINELDLRWLWRMGVYDHLRYVTTAETVRATSKRTGVATDWIRGDVAFAVIKEDPAAYLGDVALNVYAMWAAPELQSFATAERYNRYLRGHVRKAIAGDMLPPTVSGRSGLRLVISKGVRLAAAVVSLFLMVLGLLSLWRRWPVGEALSAVVIVSFFVHGYCVLVALVNAGFNRYAIMM